jgi:hypothetical protein
MANGSKFTDEEVYRAIREIVSSGNIATRESIAQLSSKSMTTLDACLSRLKEKGEIFSPARGVYAPSPPYSNDMRPVSCTVLLDGSVKVEIGDDILALSSREARYLSLMLAGFAIQLSGAENSAQFNYLCREISNIKYDTHQKTPREKAKIE